MKKIITLMLCLGFAAAALASPKDDAIVKLRKEYSAKTPWLRDEEKNLGAETASMLAEDGSFAKYRELEKNYWSNHWGSAKADTYAIQNPIMHMLTDVFNRLKVMALDIRDGKIAASEKDKLYKAVVRYGKIELDRGETIKNGRFHASCFAIPTGAAWVYLTMLDDMDSGKYPEVADILQKISFQSWSQPVRNDATQENIISVERFRKHVWWVGGNATAYRPLFEASIVNSSPEMLDVLSEVANKSISVVSQNTYDSAFWVEGFTADGAGWGHGKQCLIWGYPIHGTNGSLNIISRFKNTPWASGADAAVMETIFEFLRGSSFYFYKGTIPPVLERGNARPDYAAKRTIPSLSLTDNLNWNFRGILSKDQLSEMDQFRKEANVKNLFMLNFPMGQYHGTRYFFNNDDLIRKNPDYYVFINMVSNRSNGLESYHGGANGYNLFTCDGQTIFEREGGESSLALGASVLTMLPGTTERQTKKLNPIENWLGYGSQGDFAAGAVASNQDSAAGFIFDKVNDSVVEKPSRNEENPEILKVRAHKSYFFFGDLLLALGAGIENLAPEYDGNIFTTIEQTLKKGDNKVTRAHNIDWVGNNGFLYGDMNGKAVFKSEKRTTDWRKLSEANKNVTESEMEIFSMWIDHGREVSGATYAYMVACSGEVPAALPKVLANTTQVQAAELNGTVSAVFYESSAAIGSAHGEISVSAPCALVVRFLDGKVEISVADGKMNKDLDTITVRIKDKDYTVQLPADERLGASVTADYK